MKAYRLFGFCTFVWNGKYFRRTLATVCEAVLLLVMTAGCGSSDLDGVWYSVDSTSKLEIDKGGRASFEVYGAKYTGVWIQLGDTAVRVTASSAHVDTTIEGTVVGRSQIIVNGQGTTFRRVAPRDIAEFDSVRTELTALIEMKADLRSLVVAQEVHFSDNATYSLQRPPVPPAHFPRVRLSVEEASDSGWSAVAMYEGARSTCSLVYRKGTKLREPACIRAKRHTGQ